MLLPVLTCHESRELDRYATDEFGMPSIILMENAGRSVVDYLLGRYQQGTVLVCCGKGNNGGDGFVIARHLENHRIPVQVLLCAKPEELGGDAKTNFNIIVKAGLPIIELNKYKPLQNLITSAEWIVDALLGTGLKGPVQSPIDKIITEINHTEAHVLSVDIPSGLDGDTGRPLGIAIKAEHTVTFVSLKKGFTCSAAKEFLGNVYVADIGIPLKLIEKFK